MSLDVLAMAAHPDDVEQTCGGTLIRMAEMGYRTGVLDLTAGDMGTRGTPEQRIEESQAAARHMLLAWRDNQHMPDARLENTITARMTLAMRIRELKPRVVILPYWEARHPDHYHASTLGYEACFLAGLQQLPIGGEPHRPFKILYSTPYAGVNPTFVVDITGQYERRARAILAYGSQFRPKGAAKKSKVHLGLDELEGEMNQLARHYGQMIGVKYGEPFFIKELMKVDDVVEMEVRSV